MSRVARDTRLPLPSAPLSQRPPVIGGGELPEDDGRPPTAHLRQKPSTQRVDPAIDEAGSEEGACPLSSSRPVSAGKRSTPPGLQCDYSAEETSRNSCPKLLVAGAECLDLGGAAETRCTPPPYRKWAHSLSDLLGDRQGVAMFKSFLDAELGGVAASNSLDFWFACNGLKLVSDSPMECEVG